MSLKNVVDKIGERTVTGASKFMWNHPKTTYAVGDIGRGIMKAGRFVKSHPRAIRVGTVFAVGAGYLASKLGKKRKRVRGKATVR